MFVYSAARSKGDEENGITVGEKKQLEQKPLFIADLKVGGRGRECVSSITDAPLLCHSLPTVGASRSRSSDVAAPRRTLATPTPAPALTPAAL